MLVEQYPLDKRFEELASHFPAMDQGGFVKEISEDEGNGTEFHAGRSACMGIATRTGSPG